MIYDHRSIMIENTRLEVFELIETMPNKFPTFKFLDNRLFLFFRLALVDGFRPALKIVFDKDLWIEVKRGNPFVLKTGASFGPFTLTLLEKPAKYIFTLNSFFFNCKTGYSLKSDSKGTVLTFDLAAKNPGLMEKIWWFFVKPIHAILANKVLKRIKKEAEIG